MTTYRHYQDARDAAWRALLLLPDKRLPVDAEALAEQCGMAVHPFPGKEQQRLYALVSRAADGPCVSLRVRREWHIFLEKNRLNEAQRRFAVARELGRYFLAHETRSLAPGVRCFACRESAEDLLADPQEMDDAMADVFALRLLAPACLLHELHVDSPGKIAALCGLPPYAAAVRAERMELLNERNAYYTHALETQVRRAFLPYLNRCLGLAAEPEVKLRLASEAAPRAEIHAYPTPAGPEDVPWELPASVPRSLPPLPPSAPKRPKRPLPRLTRKQRTRLLTLLFCALAAAALYFLGK